MVKPFFTVVIPTHNRAALLKRAVDSVLTQTYVNFEIIVIDDHSTDDTSKIIESYKDIRFKYMLNQRSKGACGARNTGIFAAKGKWVAFLDDDDFWQPEKLKEQYNLIRNSSNTVGLVCTDYAIFFENDKKPKIIKNRPSGWVKDKLFYGGVIGCLSSTCVRYDILAVIQGFDERFPSNQDQDLWIRIADFAEFAFVPKPLVWMYQERRKDRIGQNMKKKLDGKIMLRNKYSDIINKNHRLRHRQESLIFAYALILGKKQIVIKTLPWFLVGIIVDFSQFYITLRTISMIFIKGKFNIQFLN